jgi:hypothetical protein
VQATPTITEEQLLAPFTREMALTLTIQDAREFWVQRNRLLRDRGLPHHTTLSNAVTGRVVATI